MNPSLAKNLFFAFERFRGERVDLFLRELETNQGLAPEDIRALQARKLNALLDTVLQKNDYYRHKYAGHDVTRDFSGLPILAKQELRANYQRIVTKEMQSLVGLHKTSGSTGEPLKFYRDRTVFGYTLASVYRAHRWHGLDVGAREAMLWGIPSSWRNRAKMRGRDFLLNRFRESEYNLDPRVLELFYRDMRRKRPDYMFGYTSMVYEFALFARERNLSTKELSLKAIICTAEMIPDYQRATMEGVFGCPVVSEYGSAETGIISYQCRRGRHHVSDDCVLLEVVDDYGRPVPVGEVGKVTVTVLHSGSAPIIRYQLGDYASLSSDTCDCGVNLSLLDRIVGRTSGIIVTPSGRCLHSIVLYYIMKDYADQFGGVRQFRVRQTDVDRLEFHIAAGGEFTSLSQQWIASKAHETFGKEMRVEFFVHDQLERAASGKLSDFESVLTVEEHLVQSFRSSNPVVFGPT